jgi:DNA-binding NtrC family response regulator/ABC-type branched-subunit amino acid transport system ATPase component
MALDNFNFEVRAGEVHAVFGESGAGKSIFIKILSGILKKDNGIIFIDGTERDIKNVEDAHSFGFSFIHEELNIFPNFSIAENIFIENSYKTPIRNSLGFISHKRMLEEAAKIPNSLDIGVDLSIKASELTPIQKWKTVINRALARKARLIFMDEPGARLSIDELKEFFECIKKLKSTGTAIVYASQRMVEIFEVADRVTILKQGKKIGTTQVRETDSWVAFKMMVGRELNNVLTSEQQQKNSSKISIPRKNIPKEDNQEAIESILHNVQFENIIGESLVIKKVLAKIYQVAASGATILLHGETGVGKELMAKAIHYHSRRVDQPFICVHCSSLPDNLLPSELFGHEKGSFTGANKRHIGRFELANGGTLFLDEIGEFSQDIQIRLLRVLQTKEFERVGGTETLRSDFRLIVATNRDLAEEVRALRFRKDLFYRLNVIPIQIPPLCERKKDIPLLAYHFLTFYAAEIGKTFKEINETDLERMVQYDWPGNIRELENIIERGTILSPNNQFQLPDIEFKIAGNTFADSVTTMREMEYRHISEALKKTNWKIRGPGGAAELLDMHFSTLRARMTKLGIARPKNNKL